MQLKVEKRKAHFSVGEVGGEAVQLICAFSSMWRAHQCWQLCGRCFHFVVVLDEGIGWWKDGKGPLL